MRGGEGGPQDRRTPRAVGRRHPAPAPRSPVAAVAIAAAIASHAAPLPAALRPLAVFRWNRPPASSHQLARRPLPARLLLPVSCRDPARPAYFLAIV